MIFKFTKHHQITLRFLFVLILLSACSINPVASPQNTAQPITESKSPTQTENQPAPSVTPSANPVELFLDEALPSDIFTQQEPGDIILSDNPDSPLWFGPMGKAPEGVPLVTSTWVYALAAPFPTLIDDVNLQDLQRFWRGHSSEPFGTVTKLHVPENLKALLDDHWLPGSAATVETYQEMPEIEAVWEDNAWAIMPFHELDPRLKVISIDNHSPLHSSFDESDYALSFTFQLSQTQETPNAVSDETLRELTGAIQITNRDPEKMTTLVMTGVTALVRATAHKMETKGILYPGEAIQSWLSEADLTHISNEVSFYEDCPFPNPNSRWLLFCSDPKYIELFEYIGANIIELTGNHNNDALYVWGKDVVPFTLDLYEQKGMQFYGGGRDIQAAKSPLIITHNGNHIAFIGCNAPGPDFAWATEEQGGAAPCGDFQWMTAEISRLRAEGVLPIATLQYYEDYYNFAESHHIKDFGRLAEAGAVIVNGSQAHRPKAMAFSYGAYIDYGLGNLFFDQMGIIDDYGNQILQTRWEKIQRHTFYDGKHLNTELLTAILEDYAQPRPMTENERQIFLEEIFSASGWGPE